MDRLEATVLNTVFRNPENGYSVVSVHAGRSDCTVVGVMPELAPGEQAVFSGSWTEHKTYGRQFACTLCEIQEPTTLLGIERFLASGLIRGIKGSTAAMIVAHFGEDTLTVMSEHPERLTEVPGIGKKRCAMISESFLQHQEARRAMVFLQSYGISPALAVRITERYGDQTPDIIRANPYRLCEDLEGVGFKTADRIGLALGFPPDSEHRIRSALIYLLQDAAASGGHVYLPEEELCSQAASLLRIPSALCRDQLAALLLARRLAFETGEDGRRIYLPVYDRAEKEIGLLPFNTLSQPSARMAV